MSQESTQCHECGGENRSNANFCSHCGVKLLITCSQCGKRLAPEANFCDGCGARLKGLANAAVGVSADTVDSTAGGGGSDAERRHLTVLFCDLVGSSNLSEQLDPEDLRELLAAYQEACATVVNHYDGLVARYVGDGILIYFGYPHAHEDDAPRAVRAALDIVYEVGNLDLDLTLPVDALAVRIGIATGTVVVGDIGTGARREQMAVVGETPNLAARLQALAGPGEVIIAAQTFRLVEGFFDIDDLGTQDLKGISQTQNAYRVRAESGARDRLDASARLGLTPLVGRQEEVAILMNRWAKTRQGESHFVAISGEAGIGKSRVIRAFRENLADEPHNRVLYYGSPYHQNSAFYPVIDQFQRALRFENDDSIEKKRAKLKSHVGRLGLEIESIEPPLAVLLSLAADNLNPGTSESGELKRRQLAAIGSVLEAMSEETPVLMVVEDVHWLDPSSLELLTAISERLLHARVLVVMTHRPEFTFTFGGSTHLTQIPLSHLGGLESTAIVTRVAGNKPFPDEVAAEIIAKTDGIPLFVEELTKSLLESGELRDDGKRFVLDNPLPPLAIPPSLQDSLMARLDRLATTKEVAQLAACIGRDFDLSLLIGVATQDETALRNALDQLVEAGLVYERGMRPDTKYEFKHVLVRDAAYHSLLKSTRQLNHQRIAETLEDKFVLFTETQPELVARHYTEAGLAEPAAVWWHRAGQRASRMDANLEAIRHLESGLELIETLDQNEACARIEADILIDLGNATRVIGGYASERAEELFSRCKSVCKRLCDKDREFAALWGMWSVAIERAELDKAAQRARHVLALAEEMGDPDLELEAHHTLWGTFVVAGDLVRTQYHAERGIKLYRFEQHGDLGYVYGNHDPGICARYCNAGVLWLQGYSEQARTHLEVAMRLIGQHSQPQFIAHGLMHCCMVFMHLADVDRIHEIQARAQPLAVEIANLDLMSFFDFIRGWARALEGDYTGGIELMEGALAARPADSSRYYNCYFLSILADTCYRNGLCDKGQSLLRQALEQVNATGERWWEAELHRLDGQAYLLMPDESADNARKCFERALEISRTQGAKMLELRAANDLSKFLRDQGACQEALDLLEPVYRWFTEGFEAADLREAKTLLEELS